MKPIRIVLCGGPCNGRKIDVPELHEWEIIHVYESRQFAAYMQDAPGKSSYFYSAEQSALLNANYDKFAAQVTPHDGYREVEFVEGNP